MKLVKPYETKLSLKDFYKKEIELEKIASYIWMFYEVDGKNYMKKTEISDAIAIIENL